LSEFPILLLEISLQYHQFYLTKAAF